MLLKKFKKLAYIKQNFDKKYPREIYMQNYLQSRNPKLKMDARWNLYLMNPWTPLICAHMDTVQTEKDMTEMDKWWLTISPKYVERWYGINKTTLLQDIIDAPWQLWWDDKCWIAIAMELYEELWDRISLLFTVEEESWMHWARYFANNNKELLEQCSYCIIPDRRNWTDLIATDKNYCTKDFLTDVLWYVWEFWFTNCLTWLACDAWCLKDHVNCINFSCWYYEPHSSDDYVVVTEFMNSYEAIRILVMNYTKRLPPYKREYKWTNQANKQPAFNNWLFGWEYWDDWEPVRWADWKQVNSETVKLGKAMLSLNYKEREMLVKKPLDFYDATWKPLFSLKPWLYSFYEDYTYTIIWSVK